MLASLLALLTLAGTALASCGDADQAPAADTAAPTTETAAVTETSEPDPLLPTADRGGGSPSGHRRASESTERGPSTQWNIIQRVERQHSNPAYDMGKA